MSRFIRLHVRRFASASSVAEPTAPTISSPVILSAVAGAAVTFLPASSSGAVQPTFTLTELLGAGDEVLASGAAVSNYTLSAGQVVQIKQAGSLLGVPFVRVSAARTVAAPTVTGWSMPSPVAADATTYSLTHASQPGSRMWFINAQTGEEFTTVNDFSSCYFMVGGNIVDSTGSATNAQGVAYGTDPYNPGAAVRRVKHWAGCGPMKNGTGPGVRSGNDGAAIYPAPGGWNFVGSPASTRDGKPDWWGFERGSAFDLGTDLDSYKASAAGAAFTSPAQSLVIPAGAGIGREAVMFSFGDLSQPMPRITSKYGWPFTQKIGGDWSHVRYLDLWFEGSDRTQIQQFNNIDGTDGPSFLNSASSHTNLVFQGCHWISCGPTSFSFVGDANIHRCLILDEWHQNIGNNSGTDFHEPWLSPWGATVTFTECVIGRSGMRWCDPERIESGEQFPIHSALAAYPKNSVVHSADRSRTYAAKADVPAGTALPGDYSETSFWCHVGTGKMAFGNSYCRNMYMDGRTIMRDCVLPWGASSEQYRRGADITGTYYQSGTIVLGHDWDGGTQFTTFADNIVELMVLLPMHTPMALQVSGPVQGADVTRNIFTRAGQSSNGFRAIQFKYQRNSQPTGGYHYVFADVMRDIAIHDNVFDCGATAFSDVNQGFKTDYPGDPAAQTDIDAFAAIGSNGMVNVSVYNNKYASSSADPDIAYQNGTYGDFWAHASATNPVAYTGNLKYTSRAAMATALSYLGVERNLRTWLNSIGLSETDESFGRHVYLKLLKGQTALTGMRPMQRGNWYPEYLSKPMVNHVRAGWNFQPLP